MVCMRAQDMTGGLHSRAQAHVKLRATTELRCKTAGERQENRVTAASKKLTSTHVLDSSRVIGLKFMNSSTGLPFSLPKSESQKSCCSRCASNHEQHMQICSRMSLERSWVHPALREVMCTFVFTGARRKGIWERATNWERAFVATCCVICCISRENLNPEP
jgi:hypothetical protein